MDTRWQKLVKLVVRNRVRISALVFIALILEDVLEGVRPHNPFDIHDAMGILGLGLVIAGLSVRSWAAGILHKRTQLTTTGPYGIVRNPLYIGSFLLLLGFCALIDDAENIWFAIGPFAILYVLKVRQEERVLSQAFGEQWLAYTRSTPRFLPTRWPRDVFESWRLPQWMANREYRATITAMAGVMAVVAWRWL